MMACTCKYIYDLYLRRYSLRDLLFALQCARLSHPDYFLACVTHAPRVAPVPLNPCYTPLHPLHPLTRVESAPLTGETEDPVTCPYSRCIPLHA